MGDRIVKGCLVRHSLADLARGHPAICIQDAEKGGEGPISWKCEISST
jgi:hypothetical protein